VTEFCGYGEDRFVHLEGAHVTALFVLESGESVAENSRSIPRFRGCRRLDRTVFYPEAADRWPTPVR